VVLNNTTGAEMSLYEKKRIDLDEYRRDEHLTKFGWSFGLSCFVVVFMWWFFIGSKAPEPLPQIIKIVQEPSGLIDKKIPSVSEIVFREPIPEHVRPYVTIVEHEQGNRAIWKGVFREGIYFIATDDDKESSPVGALDISEDDTPEEIRNIVPASFVDITSFSPSRWDRFLFWFLSPLVTFIAFMVAKDSWAYCLGGLFNFIKRILGRIFRTPLMVIASLILGNGKELNWDYKEGEGAPPAWNDSRLRKIQKSLFPWAYRFDLKNRAFFSSAWLWHNSPKDRHLAFGTIEKKDLDDVISDLDDSISDLAHSHNKTSNFKRGIL
jgi:hypothetical protein